jgi:predicted AAA+ superfamily ATPase
MTKDASSLEESRLLEKRMIYGYYPEVVNHPGDEREILTQLADSYLYKDIFIYGNIKKPVVLEKLLIALALQVGNEVNYLELGQTVGADKETVERYIDLLEKSFVVFKLISLNRNLRNEIKKGRKIYFYDNGIRNSIIKNFNPLDMRQDAGALWENFLIVERMKRNSYGFFPANTYFWRTTFQQEIDYVEEYEGVLHAFEFKINRKTGKLPRQFTEAYPSSEFRLINGENYREFIL